MLKFTLAFILFLFAGILLIILQAYYIGKWQAKADYKKDYEKLKMAVEYSIINHLNFKTIVEMFEEINRYKCRDKLKIVKLKEDFYKKFKNIINDFGE